MEVYQPWFEHSEQVAQQANLKLRAALGAKAASKKATRLYNACFLHDLGKLIDKVQQWYRVYCLHAHGRTFFENQLAAHTFYRYKTKEDEEAALKTTKEVGRRPGHRSPGTAYAMEEGWTDAAMLIAGHHGGLPDLLDDTQKKSLRSLDNQFVPRDERDTDSDQEFMNLVGQYREEALEEGRKLVKKVEKKSKLKRDRKGKMKVEEINVESEFMIRLLFSCLVDADWENTDQWMRTQKGKYADIDFPPLRDLFKRHKHIDTYREKKRQTANKDLVKLRDAVYKCCVDASKKPTGVFTLNAPTGSAKTVGFLVFALRHAQKYRLRRIIYVVHYLATIEQNAREIREALGLIDNDELYLVEHHTVADPIDPMNVAQEHTIRMKTTNWSASIIITTNVQFFDSVFSPFPRSCRKFHNIARSVVILDECQHIHPSLCAPTCQMINQFVEKCKTTFVLATATQPQWHQQLKGFKHRLKAHAIIKRPKRLFELAEKTTNVQVNWPTKGSNTWAYPELVNRMLKSGKQAAGIVDTRRKAKDLFGELKSRSLSEDDLFHLSTSMCVLHRCNEFYRLQSQLNKKKSVYVAATPLFEIGINIDFPVSFREWCPLELVIQAAGRVNREGKRKCGRLILFNLKDYDGQIITDKVHAPPDAWYKMGRETLAQIIGGEGSISLSDTKMLQAYFRNLYAKGNLDEYNICKLREIWSFYTVGYWYRTIKDDSRPVVCATWNEKYGNVVTEKYMIDRMTRWFNYAQIAQPHPDEKMSIVIQRVNDALREKPWDRWLLNLISYLSANMYWRKFEELKEKTTLIYTDEDTGVDFWAGEYDSRTGLIY